MVLTGFSYEPWSSPGIRKKTGYITRVQMAVPMTPSTPMSSHGGAMICTRQPRPDEPCQHQSHSAKSDLHRFESQSGLSLSLASSPLRPSFKLDLSRS
eukprot:6190871-Pleurochrysis_carterae.AAC.1